MHRRTFIHLTTMTAATSLLRPCDLTAASVSEDKFDPSTDIIKAPKDPALWPKFREQLAAWREQKRHELNYSDALYRRPELAWAASSFASYFLMLGDERFYNATTGHYRLQEWLAGLQRDFNGCDSVVLWHAYPRIGLDERNQYDFYRDQPGGLAGLRKLVDQLHAAGLRSYIDYNPWDTGTRRETKNDVDLLCEMVGTLDVDGIYLDTLRQGAAEFRRKLDAVRPGAVLEGEVALPVERIEDHHQAWAQLFVDSEAPGVVRNKWFERRHLLHHTDRWSRDRTAQFHSAFMNGTGTAVWDNIFGTWNGYSAREKSIMRAMLPIQRRYAALFAGEEWTPLVPTLVGSVYASLWQGSRVRLWTLINRAEQTTSGQLLQISLAPGEKLWDLVSGNEIESPSSPIGSRGVGCFVAAQLSDLGSDFSAFLQQQHATAARSDWSTAFPDEVQTRLQSAPRTEGHSRKNLPVAMTLIPGGAFHFAVEMRVRECGEYESTHPRTTNQWPSWRPPTTSWVTRDVELATYAMDLTPVTNGQFAEFLQATHYHPRVEAKFLHHWNEGKIPAGLEDHPVVYVDLDDARAYARWSGKRLPTEEEWQFAAQGSDGRRYPWGNDFKSDLCNGHGVTTTPVRQFPEGRSPFGIYDLCGNTWEWTESERSDGINRFVMIRGGSYYQAEGTIWYMDGGACAASYTAKFLLTWPGLDRCSTVGFRCVVDLE